MHHIIYGLYDPEDEAAEIRYVGYSSKGEARRLTEHLCEAKSKNSNHRHRWLNSLTRRGLRPEIVVLEIVTADNWRDREKFHISRFPNLVNSTIGGEGLIDPSPDVRKRIGEKVSVALKGNGYRRGIPHGPDSLIKISAGMSRSEKWAAFNERRLNYPRRKMSEEHKEKIRQTKLGKPRPWTPEWKAKIAAGAVGKKQSAETVAKRAKTLIGNTRALGVVRTAEFRAAIVASRTGTRMITNGETRKFIRPGDVIPPGWRFSTEK